MRTYFASPERSEFNVLQSELETITKNPVINAVMETVGGLLAVLNEHRQVLAVNEVFLRALDLEALGDNLGLRLGEVIHCIHSGKQPGGCGTTRYCATCGAVIAMVASLAKLKPAEKECVITIEEGGEKKDCYFHVRAVPIQVDDATFLLLFLRDVTQDQQRAVMEHVFFHDIRNIIQGLSMAGHLIKVSEPEESGPIISQMKGLIDRLNSEVEMQRILTYARDGELQPQWELLSPLRILHELKDNFRHHPAATDKTLDIVCDERELTFFSDRSILLRVLTNLALNALEASEKSHEVKIKVIRQDQDISFQVWNRTPIPAKAALRVFQRNFSTKGSMGRGLGTYSAKLFTERYLGGRIGFTSTLEEGTLFWITLPIHQKLRH